LRDGLNCNKLQHNSSVNRCDIRRSAHPHIRLLTIASRLTCRKNIVRSAVVLFWKKIFVSTIFIGLLETLVQFWVCLQGFTNPFTSCSIFIFVFMGTIQCVSFLWAVV